MTLIALNILSRREELGLSQAELARAVGVSAATLSRWENGGNVPSPRHLISLASALRTSSDALHATQKSPAATDVTKLARSIDGLETALGSSFVQLSSLKRATLISFVYDRGGDVSPDDVAALRRFIA